MHKRKNIWENQRERDTAKILKYPRTAQLHSRPHHLTSCPLLLLIAALQRRCPLRAIWWPLLALAGLCPSTGAPLRNGVSIKSTRGSPTLRVVPFRTCITALAPRLEQTSPRSLKSSLWLAAVKRGVTCTKRGSRPCPALIPGVIHVLVVEAVVHGVARACMPCTPITHPRSPLRPLTHSSFLPLLHLFMLPPSSLAHCTSQLAALSTTLAPDPGSRPGAPSHEWRTVVPCHRLKHERYTHTPYHHAVSSCKFSLLLLCCSGPPGSPPGGVASGTPTTAVVRQSSGGASRAVMLDLCITVVAPFVAIIVLLVALLHLALRSK